jgi:tetratricopeptide (TPR) repeat protein
MEREIVGKRPTFRPAKPGMNIYRVMLWISLILAGIWLLLGIQRGEIQSPLAPTPTPTRMPNSFIQEAEAYFQAGKLYDPDPPLPTPARYDAIDTYQRALQIEPDSALTWAELARIQTYSSLLLSTDDDRQKRLGEALESIEKAVALDPDSSIVHAVRAFVLDWNATGPLTPREDIEDLLTEAQNSALRAYQLDHDNALALAYYAEVLLDQQNWSQAEQYASQAVMLDPNSMDAHRVYGTVLESVGKYNSAIKEYLRAAEINPNLTFLYVFIGRNYATLASAQSTTEQAKQIYMQALEYYARAADINKQLGVKDPLPNLEIAKTYAQMGEFFIAARNAETALSYDATSANTYGRLGNIYIKSRNYEGAMPALKCAVRGCTAEENEPAKNLVDQGLLDTSVPVTGLRLTNKTVAYYYTDYGTVLAFLSRPAADKNFCPQARQVLAEVRAAYPDDPTLMTIVEDSEGICRNLEGGAPLPASTPEEDDAGTGDMEAVESTVSP